MALGANKANSVWKLRRSRVGPGFQAVVPPVMSAEERELAQQKYVEDRPHIFGGKNKDEAKVDYSKVEKPVSSEEIEREFMAKAAPPEFDFKAFVKQCRQMDEQKREGPAIGNAWRRSTRNKKVVDYRDPEDDVEMEEKSHAPPSKSKRGNKPRLILTRKRKRPRDDDDNGRRSSSPQKRKAISTNGDATNDDHPRKKRRRGRPRKDEIDSFNQNTQAEVIDLCDDDDESTAQDESNYTSRRAPSNIVAPPAPVDPSLSRGLDLLSTPADRAAYGWNVLAHQGAWQAYTSLLANFNQRDNKTLSAFLGNRFGRNLSALNQASFLSSGMPALTSQLLAGKTGLTSTRSTTNMTANNSVGKNRQKSSAPSSLKVNQYGYVYTQNDPPVPPAIPPPRPLASPNTATKTVGIDSSTFNSNREGISCLRYTGEPRQDVPSSAKTAPKQSESSNADVPTNNSGKPNSSDGQPDVIRLD